MNMKTNTLVDVYQKGREDAIKEIEKALYEYGFFNAFSMKLEIYKEDLVKALEGVKNDNRL